MALAPIFACLVVVPSADRIDVPHIASKGILGYRGQDDGEANVTCDETVEIILNTTGRRTDYDKLKREITNCGSVIKILKVDYSTHEKPAKYFKAIWKGLRKTQQTMFESLDLSRKDPKGKGYMKGIAVETTAALGRTAHGNGFEYLKEIISKSPKLKVLKLDNNFIGTEDAAGLGMLAEALKTVRLTTLSFRNNNFDDHQLRDFFPYWWQRNLQQLYLGGNRLTFEGWLFLKPFETVEVFDASSNKISDSGAKFLGGALKNVSVLRVAKNDITQDGVEYLLDCSEKLSELDISHNDCRGLEWRAWQDSSTKTVKKLKVANAKLAELVDVSKPNSIYMLVEELVGFETLVELDLSGNIDASASAKMKEFITQKLGNVNVTV